MRIENSLSAPFKIGRGVRQGCILSPDLFNIYGEHIIRTVLDGWNGGISVGKKISNLRYADDTTLIAASEEEMSEILYRNTGSCEGEIHRRIGMAKSGMSRLSKI